MLVHKDEMSNAVCFASFAIGQLDTAMNQLIAHSETSLGMMQFRLLHEHYQMLCQSVSEAFPLETRWRSLPKGIQPLRLVWDCTNVLSESACHYLQPLATPETVMLLEPSMLERYREVSLLPVSVTDDE